MKEPGTSRHRCQTNQDQTPSTCAVQVQVVRPDFAMCGAGRRQSPINIKSAASTTDTSISLSFSMFSDLSAVLNNGFKDLVSSTHKGYAVSVSDIGTRTHARRRVRAHIPTHPRACRRIPHVPKQRLQATRACVSNALRTSCGRRVQGRRNSSGAPKRCREVRICNIYSSICVFACLYLK